MSESNGAEGGIQKVAVSSGASTFARIQRIANRLRKFADVYFCPVVSCKAVFESS